VSAALPIARFGTDAQVAALSDVVAGERLLTAALVEYGAEPDDPYVTATREGDGWRVDGVKHSVGAASVASHALVSARAGDEVVMLLVPTGAPGVSLARQEVMNHEPVFEMTFASVRVGDDAVLGSSAQGREILTWLLDRTIIATCAMVSGVADRALKLTAEYTTERKQFDRQIGTFQAVGQRMADCYIDNQAIELTMLQAATHLDEGRDDPVEIATAKFWVAEGANHIGHAALHIHGGISIDVDFPVHRYFLWLKRYEFSLGSATPELLRIGKALADTPVSG